MIPVLSREQMREFDRYAIEDCRVPSLVLMENAGRGATDVIENVLCERRADGTRGARVVVLCGPGNNGGDGFVVARRLRGHGAEVSVWLTTAAAQLGGDALANYQAWQGIGGAVTELPDESGLPALREALGGCDLVIDALLGTGLDRDVRGRLASVIELVNAADAPCVALDIPSGLDANRGVVLGVAVQALATVTFAHRKRGLLCTQGAERAGRIHVADIGVPADLGAREGSVAYLLETADVRQLLLPRSVATHKGSAGRVLAVCGSPGKTGAAALVGHAAMRSGAGLVTVATSPQAADALDQRVFEVMTARIDPKQPQASLDPLLARTDVVVTGPGLGIDDEARGLVDHVVLAWDGVKVVDADAITHFGGRASELRAAPGQCILTPHPGEAARLLEISAAEVEADRFAAAERLVEVTGQVVLLKGPRTLIAAPGQPTVINAVDCPALASGGAGDVLAGVCAALACILPPREAALCAAHLHGLAAEQWSARTGSDRGLLAREVADGIPDAIPGAIAAVAAAG